MADLSRWAGRNGERRCLVAICHNGPVVFTPTARSLMEIGWGDRTTVAKEAHGFAEIGFHWATHFPRVDALRDASADLALREGFTHLLFLDADMVWPTDVIERMLRHYDAGIVGGLYCLKGPPYAPVALADEVPVDGSSIRHYAFQTEYGRALVPVNVLGMGCTLVPVQVFRDLGARPWFEYGNDDLGWPLVSEDVTFCQRAQAAGYPILFDPTVKCGHVNVQVIDERFHKRYQQSVKETETRATMRLVPGERAPAAEGR